MSAARRAPSAALALLLACAAAGCGQKGPLTLPPAPGAGTAADSADTEQTEDERRDDE